MATAWNRSGIIKGAGIPSPTGPFNVGCVDVMHHFEGDTTGLLVKLFYPTGAVFGGQYPYSDWLSHKRYIRGMLDYAKTSAAGLMTTLMDTFMCEGYAYSPGVLLMHVHILYPWRRVSLYPAPKAPALYGAPLFVVNGSSATDGTNGVQVVAGNMAADMAPAAALPLVVFSHGLGAMRATASAACCDLASHGYVVGAVEHRCV